MQAWCKFSHLSVDHHQGAYSVLTKRANHSIKWVIQKSGTTSDTTFLQATDSLVNFRQKQLQVGAKNQEDRFPITESGRGKEEGMPFPTNFKCWKESFFEAVVFWEKYREVKIKKKKRFQRFSANAVDSFHLAEKLEKKLYDLCVMLCLLHATFVSRKQFSSSHLVWGNSFFSPPPPLSRGEFLYIPPSSSITAQLGPLRILST